MFKVHKIWSRELSAKNLIMLFFTIVLGFASMITLAQLTIDANINNAWQTIAGISITATGNNTQSLIELSSGGLTINAGGLYMKWSGIVIASSAIDSIVSFSWKVLWIDNNGNIIYTTGLIIPWADAWTVTGNNIYRLTGNVGIGTSNPIYKLHIVNSGSTDVYIEEQKQGQAASLNLKNPARTRTIWWDSSPDIFYISRIIGTTWWTSQEDFNIDTWWDVNIWMITWAYKLDVSGDIRSLGNMRTSGTYYMGTNDVGQYMITWAGTVGQVWISDWAWRGIRSGSVIPIGTAIWATLYRNWSSWISNTNIFNSWLNIGIGTNNPSYKLDVSGDIRANGSIRVWNITATCNSSNQWSMRFSGACFQWCDGYNWEDIWWSWCAIMCTWQ